MKTIGFSAALRVPLDWMSLATVIYGARGSGKTSLGAVMAEEVTKARQRFCAVDLKGDWYGLKSTADGKGDGIPVVVFGGDHQDVPLEDGSGAFIGETVAGLDQSCILDLEYLSKGKQVRFLAAFFEKLYDTNRTPLLLLLDEAQRYAPQRPIDPDAAKCLGAVEDLVKLGRKHGIGPVLFTQRGSGLNKEVSELCDMMVAFRTPGPLDQDRIKDWLDANTTKAERDKVMGQLSGLPTGTAVFASGHPDMKTFGVFPVRRRETFDSSATPKVGQRKIEPKQLAKPDLEKLREKMAGAIERQKADDPRALRARIAELEKKLALVEVELADGLKVTETVTVPAVSEEMAARLERAKDALGSASREAVDAAGTIALAVGDLRRHMVVPGVLPPGLRARPRAALGSGQPKPGRRAMHPAQAGDRALGRGERTVLIAIAQHQSGVSREQLTVLTGYKRSSRDTYIQKLRSAGLIEDGATITATGDGAAALGDDYEPLPTGRALLDHWMQRLPEGERRVLGVLVQYHPHGADRTAIDEATGYKRSSRDTYLQKLSARKLVVSSDGRAWASEELFG